MRSYLQEMEPRLHEGLELAKSLGASAAAIHYGHRASREISFEANRLKTCASDETQNYSVDVVVNGRTGTASSNIPSALTEMVRRAVDFAKGGAVSHYDTLPAPKGEYARIENWSQSVLDLQDDKLIADCQSLVDRIRALDADNLANAGVSISESEGSYATSGGCYRTTRGTHWDLGAGFDKTSGTDMLFSGAYRGWGKVDSSYDLEAIFDEVRFEYEHAQRIVKTEAGNLPLLVPPQLIRSFLTPVTMGINGRNVFKGTSPLKGKVGEKCFASNFTLTDNPHMDFTGGASFDDAGLPTEKKDIIRDGVLTGFLYDYDTAGMAGCVTTHNPGCAPIFPMVKPGERSLKEMLSGVKRGILVKQMIGFGQTNMANGDFSANLGLGFLIENGEVVGRLKDAMISGNILELLAGNVEFSAEVHPTRLQPFMLMDGVSLKI